MLQKLTIFWPDVHYVEWRSEVSFTLVDSVNFQFGKNTNMLCLFLLNLLRIQLPHAATYFSVLTRDVKSRFNGMCCVFVSWSSHWIFQRLHWLLTKMKSEPGTTFPQQIATTNETRKSGNRTQWLCIGLATIARNLLEKFQKFSHQFISIFQGY